MIQPKRAPDCVYPAPASTPFAGYPVHSHTPWRQNRRPAPGKRGAKPAHCCWAHVYRVQATFLAGAAGLPWGLRHSGILPELTFTPAQSSLHTRLPRAGLPWYPHTEELDRPCESPLSLPGIRGEKSSATMVDMETRALCTLGLMGRKAYAPENERPLAAPRAQRRPLNPPVAPCLNPSSVWCCRGLAGALGTNWPPPYPRFVYPPCPSPQV